MRTDQASVILVVEDDATQRMLLSETLEIAGYSSLEAINGEDALKVIEAQMPDAILMDVMMPIMNGFQACQEIRKRTAWQDIPIIMMTGLDDVGALHNAYESGATDFLTKPIQYELLDYRLRYMLRSASINRELRSSKHRMVNTQRIAKLGHWEWSRSTDKFEWSDEALRILEVEPTTTLEEFLRKVPANEMAEVSDWFRAAQEGKLDSSIHHHFLCRDTEKFLRQHSEHILDENGELLYVYGSLIDITDIRRANERIHQLAYFDGLTGLPNREQFRDRLEGSIQAAKRKSRRMATLFMDIDHFKRVNDTLGHAMGDKLLRQVAERIRLSLRAGDNVEHLGYAEDQHTTQVARIGGDEFTILLSEIDQPEDAAIVARRILESLTKPYDLDGQEIFVTSSIGISVFPEDGEDMDTLLKQADVAMYTAKREGRNGYRFFRKEMNAAIERRMAVENELRKAMERNELCLHYQPQLNLEDGSFCGAEALIRWTNETLGGEVEPEEFIDIAEEYGLILPIGKWVIDTACQDLVNLRKAGRAMSQVSVNVSVAQFESPDFIDDVKEALSKAGLPGDSLELELTESLMLSNFDQILSSIEALQKLGVKFAIDDFGTGYSSLTYLKRLNLDRLKIDKSFVQDLSKSQENAAITKAVIALAGGLDLVVIAEGVEEASQKDLLATWGCHEIQGFLVSYPVPYAELLAQLPAAQN